MSPFVIMLSGALLAILSALALIETAMQGYTWGALAWLPLTTAGAYTFVVGINQWGDDDR